MPSMIGMSLKSIKSHPSLIPLYFCLFAGGTAVIVSGVRCALKNPDVTWSFKTNPEPWQKYADKDYKLLNPNAKKGWTNGFERPTSIWN